MKSLVVIACLGLSAMAIALRPGSADTNLKVGEPPLSTDSQSIEQFEIGKGGRTIIVPVQFNGRDVPFMLDTGAAKSVFDSSLREELKSLLPSSKIVTSAGEVAVEQFFAPVAHVGTIDFRIVESIHCIDLSSIRQATGNEVFGIIGMDFLRQFAVEIDLDQGKLQLHKKAPQEWASEHEKTPLAFHDDGIVRMNVDVSSMSDAFMVDTGANASYLERNVFDDLMRRGELQACGTARALTVGGTIHDSLGLVKSCRVGSFAHKNIRMNRDSRSGLGMQYLARYHLRFDFPNKAAYLTKSSRFARGENVATSGMGILVASGRKTVVSVERYGPAYRAGVQIGDYIESVDGADAKALDMHDVGEILTSEANRQVNLGIVRGGQAFPVIVTLVSRL